MVTWSMPIDVIAAAQLSYHAHLKEIITSYF